MSIFEDKSMMPGNANAKMATSDIFSPRSDAPVRTSQTLRELYDSRRADDAQGVVNLNRPRRGHAY